MALTYILGATIGIIFLVKIFKSGALLSDNKLNRKDNPTIYYLTVVLFVFYTLIMLMLTYFELTR